MQPCICYHYSFHVLTYLSTQFVEVIYLNTSAITNCFEGSITHFLQQNRLSSALTMATCHTLLEHGYLRIGLHLSIAPQPPNYLLKTSGCMSRNRNFAFIISDLHYMNFVPNFMKIPPSILVLIYTQVYGVIMMQLALIDCHSNFEIAKGYPLSLRL